MKVSVVIVNHQDCKVLDKCLKSLVTATDDINAEIILVDTSGNSNTIDSIMCQYPKVRIITSDFSKGRSTAINQGIRLAKGEYILLLNCDAIVQGDTISKATAFMDGHPFSGGTSVRVLDLNGNYLTKSKKILPNAWMTFFKVFGLLKLFPRSGVTAGFIRHKEDEFETSETDTLNNNFMLIRKSVIDEIGMMDERFISYGGNIDLSYRIRLAGYKNYYFPKTYIIDQQNNTASKYNWQHLKGFYGAMFIFALKYLFSLPAINLKPMQELYPAYGIKG